MKMNRLTAGCLESALVCHNSALVALARHGSKGGEFTVSTWANGNRMVTFQGAKVDYAVSEQEFFKLKAANWKIKV